LRRGKRDERKWRKGVSPAHLFSSSPFLLRFVYIEKMDQIAWICGWCSGCFDNRRDITLDSCFLVWDSGVAALSRYLGLARRTVSGVCHVSLLLRRCRELFRKYLPHGEAITMKSGVDRCPARSARLPVRAKVLSTRAQ